MLGIAATLSGNTALYKLPSTPGDLYILCTPNKALLHKGVTYSFDQVARSTVLSPLLVIAHGTRTLTGQVHSYHIRCGPGAGSLWSHGEGCVISPVLTVRTLLDGCV